MEAELLHIFIQPKAGVTTAQIEEKLDLAVDWFRYRDNCYLVYTSKSPKMWDDRFSDLTRPGGNILILVIDPYDYKGFMPKSLWPWLRDKKKRIYGE